MKKLLVGCLFFVSFFLLIHTSPGTTFAQSTTPKPRKATPTPTASAATAATISAQLASPSPTSEPTMVPRTDLTQKSEESVGPLEKLLQEQSLSKPGPANIFKYAIRRAVAAGVPANTIVLLLLLPVIAAIIAAMRHLIGLRGFGIFLPAALSVVFLAIGPVLGISLFLVIITVSATVRIVIRKLKLKLQYLPRMALLLLFVSLAVLGVLFASPIISISGVTNVSIFPVLILSLLAEDFTKVQMGKSAKTAINVTTETLILALLSYMFLTFKTLQEFALLNPEALLISVAIFNFIVGKYVGLRFLEYWRFRKLINS